MDLLLKLSRAIDWLNDRCATVAWVAVFASCLISATNAMVRYGFNYTSNAYTEMQWYLFAVCVMLGAAQVLRINEHVRVDVLYGSYKGKYQAISDLAGFLLFLLPSMAIMFYYAWPLFAKMFISGEMSSQSGGLIRWPAMLMLPLGFALLFLQGISEAIKRIAWLMHQYQGDFHYERPLQ
jgi:TRAP-type mannitol/chloroaromatic compound transport system permease small subunit